MSHTCINIYACCRVKQEGRGRRGWDRSGGLGRKTSIRWHKNPNQPVFFIHLYVPTPRSQKYLISRHYSITTVQSVTHAFTERISLIHSIQRTRYMIALQYPLSKDFFPQHSPHYRRHNRENETLYADKNHLRSVLRRVIHKMTAQMKHKKTHKNTYIATEMFYLLASRALKVTRLMPW